MAFFSIFSFVYSLIQLLLIYRIYRLVESRVPEEDRDRVTRIRIGSFVLLLMIMLKCTAGASLLYASQEDPKSTHRIRIAVSSFSENSGSSTCGPWLWNRDWMGDDFRDQLTTELAKLGKFEILERKNIEKVYEQEHRLINADPKLALTKNKFRTAQYSIMGNVTAFELCADGAGGAVDVGSLIGIGSLEVGVKKQNAKAVINIRIVDATTGEVIHSFVAEGKAASASGSISAEFLRNLRFSSSAFQKTPLGLAAQEALKKAAEEIGKRI